MKKIILLTVCALLIGCTAPTPEEQMTTLVNVYADVSCAQIMSPTPELAPEELAAIYARHGFQSEQDIAELRASLDAATFTTTFTERVRARIGEQCITQRQ